MTALVNKKPTIVDILKQSEKEIARALPKHMTADRMARIALTEMRKNPKLMECDPKSFIGAIIQCSQLGLEPGAHLGHAYLIPFRNNKRQIVECNMMPGYRGYIDLAMRGGKVNKIVARVVKTNDIFDVDYGINEKLVHKPALTERGETHFAYAFAQLANGSDIFDVLNLDDLAKARKASKNPGTTWDDWFDEMARKTAVRRLFKYLPTSIELQRGMELDALNDEGRSQGNTSLIDPTYEAEFEAMDDTTVKNELAKGVEENEKIKCQKLMEQILLTASKLKETGFKDDEILKKLGVKSFGELSTENSTKLDAALDVLFDLETR